jgi:hypothetical protein
MFKSNNLNKLLDLLKQDKSKIVLTKDSITIDNFTLKKNNLPPINTINNLIIKKK